VTLLKSISYFVCGGILIIFVPVASRRFGPEAGGLIVLFPVVTLVGFTFLGMESGTADVSRAALAAVRGLPTVLVFLIIVHLFARADVPFPLALVAGLVSWLLTAMLILRFLSW
jgi:uncharacterized membrane protein (GlpM family)